jgi:hypothetical protein
LRIEDQIRLGLVAKPGHLTLRVAASGALDGGYRLVEPHLASQVGDQLGEAYRLHRGQIRIETAGGERRRLGESARLDHRDATAIACGIEQVTLRREQYRRKLISRYRITPLLPDPDRHPGRPDHLKGAHQPLFVSRKETLSADPIELCQALTKRDAAQRPIELDRLLPDLRRDFRHRREPFLDSPDVETSAADKNRQPPRFPRGGNFAESKSAPPCDRAAFGRIEKAVEAMRRPLFSNRVRTCGQYAQIAIALQAVGVDDRAAQGIRQLECERGFAARRRTGNDEDRGRVIRPHADLLEVGRIGGIGG